MFKRERFRGIYIIEVIFIWEETRMAKKKAFNDKNVCVACGVCTKVCPKQVMKIVNGILLKNFHKPYSYG